MRWWCWCHAEKKTIHKIILYVFFFFSSSLSLVILIVEKLHAKTNGQTGKWEKKKKIICRNASSPKRNEKKKYKTIWKNRCCQRPFPFWIKRTIYFTIFVFVVLALAAHCFFAKQNKTGYSVWWRSQKKNAHINTQTKAPLQCNVLHELTLLQFCFVLHMYLLLSQTE